MSSGFVSRPGKGVDVPSLMPRDLRDDVSRRAKSVKPEPAAFAALTRALGLRRFEPIPLPSLAFGLVRSAKERAPLGTVLEGAALFAFVSPASR